MHIFYMDALSLLSLPKEIEKLRLEVSESKQRLEQEQQKATQAREECLKLTELLGESEHQLHLTRYSLIPLCTIAPIPFHWFLPQASKQLWELSLSHSVHTQLLGVLRKVEMWWAKHPDKWMISVAVNYWYIPKPFIHSAQIFRWFSINISKITYSFYYYHYLSC